MFLRDALLELLHFLNIGSFFTQRRLLLAPHKGDVQKPVFIVPLLQVLGSVPIVAYLLSFFVLNARFHGLENGLRSGSFVTLFLQELPQVGRLVLRVRRFGVWLAEELPVGLADLDPIDLVLERDLTRLPHVLGRFGDFLGQGCFHHHSDLLWLPVRLCQSLPRRRVWLHTGILALWT